MSIHDEPCFRDVLSLWNWTFNLSKGLNFTKSGHVIYVICDWSCLKGTHIRPSVCLEPTRTPNVDWLVDQFQPHVLLQELWSHRLRSVVFQPTPGIMFSEMDYCADMGWRLTTVESVFASCVNYCEVKTHTWTPIKMSSVQWTTRSNEQKM